MNKNLPKFFRICLEGNIGCGKSTMLKCLRDRHRPIALVEVDVDHPQDDEFIQIEYQENVHMIITPEPIKQWTNIGDDNLLSMMYSNPERWAMTFEHYSQVTRYLQMKSVFSNLQSSCQDKNDLIHIHLMERSIYSNRFGFVENFHQTGKLQHVELQVLDHYFDYLRSKPESFVDLFVYLRIDPKVAYDRLVKRFRKEESSVSLEYLQQIHDMHEKLFEEKQADIWERMPDPSKCQVVSIDANRTVNRVYENLIMVFNDFIKNQLNKHSE